MRWPFRAAPPTLAMVHYDYAGWTIYDESLTHRRWWTADRTAVMVQFAVGDPVTSYPFAFTSQPDMAAFYEQQARDADGVMLEIAPATVAGIPAVRGVFKYWMPEEVGTSLAKYYVGILVVAFHDCWVQVNTEAWERGTTGMREALVAVMHPDPPPTTEPIKVEGTDEWYTLVRSTPLQRLPADDPQYDDLIPDYPLSRVRRAQQHMLTTLRFDRQLQDRPAYRYIPRR